MTKLTFDIKQFLDQSDPRDVPTYGIPEAAHYLVIPPATLRSWVLGRTYPTDAGPRQFRPIIHLPHKKVRLLSFNNLVEAHVLNAFRRKHRIPFRAIRSAVNYLRTHLESKHPLIDQEFGTDGVALFIDRLGRLVDVSAGGQTVMKEIVKAHLQRIDRDPTGSAIRLYPFTRNHETNGGKHVMIDPLVSFGRPVLRGTNIPTAVIAERYKAGDSIDDLAGDYGRSRQQIEEALRCELPPIQAA